jgi:hypothetical protein
MWLCFEAYGGKKNFPVDGFIIKLENKALSISLALMRAFYFIGLMAFHPVKTFRTSSP